MTATFDSMYPSGFNHTVGQDIECIVCANTFPFKSPMCIHLQYSCNQSHSLVNPINLSDQSTEAHLNNRLKHHTHTYINYCTLRYILVLVQLNFQKQHQDHFSFNCQTMSWYQRDQLEPKHRSLIVQPKYNLNSDLTPYFHVNQSSSWFYIL